MECPIVSEHVHKLNYSEATAKDLIEALQPAFDAAYKGNSLPDIEDAEALNKIDFNALFPSIYFSVTLIVP